MIADLLLKFGTAPGVPANTIPITPVTVFVGPNNSGKSKILREIEQFCVEGQKNANANLLDKLTFIAFSKHGAIQAIAHISERPAPGEAQRPGHLLLGSRRHRVQVSEKRLIDALEKPNGQESIFASWFLSHLTIKLDGPSRVGLVDQQSAGDLQKPPKTSLQVLFQNSEKRAEVRRIVEEAFGTYFVIDPTLLGILRIRLSPREPKNDMEERNVHAEGVAFHAAALDIMQASDGVKAFTGIIVELIAGDPRILLIDEPEAFLHPALASKLGYEVSRAAVRSDKRVFASTHSPMFLMGCIQSGAPINIVRLTYRNNTPTARVLPSDEILELMKNPLLRSIGVLNGLFYEFVVVTESDADRAFYQEINERLLRFKPEWGIPNCLFLNAQGKHTVHTILRPLRKLGIPAAAIVDVDVVKEGGMSWGNLISGANISQTLHGSLSTLRASIKAAMDATDKNMKREGGIRILDDSDREAAENLFKQLGSYGVFAVPGGELESWLKELGATGHGPSWLIETFEKMGEDPDSASYVKPCESDVWKFMSEVKTWLIDLNRKGIPS